MSRYQMRDLLISLPGRLPPPRELALGPDTQPDLGDGDTDLEPCLDSRPPPAGTECTMDPDGGSGQGDPDPTIDPCGDDTCVAEDTGVCIETCQPAGSCDDDSCGPDSCGDDSRCEEGESGCPLGSCRGVIQTCGGTPADDECENNPESGFCLGFRNESREERCGVLSCTDPLRGSNPNPGDVCDDVLHPSCRWNSERWQECVQDVIRWGSEPGEGCDYPTDPCDPPTENQPGFAPTNSRHTLAALQSALRQRTRAP